jgi:phosphoribosylformylglycinamidine synthase
MTPYEILLSESQERMLIIVHKGREDEVKRIFDKWDLPWAEVGEVTGDGMMVVKNHGEVIATVPAAKLADDAPLYHRDSKEPAYLEQTRALRLADIPALADPRAALAKLLGWPTIASKNWVYRQYDHMVRAGTVLSPGSDAAVIRVKADSYPALPADAPADDVPDKYLAMTVDCNGVHVYLDPYEGSKATVAEAARNLVCSGARPLGATDNLNFGNPHNPELFWQLKESVRGLAEACEAFGTPVTGGNVSLYNQNPAGAIDPTPTVGMVGLVENTEHITSQWFKDDEDAIILLGQAVNSDDPLLGLGGSALLQTEHGRKEGTPPPCDLAKESALHDALLGLIATGAVKSAHDCAEGGLVVALAECCISQLTARNTPRLTGATIDLGELDCPRTDALLFGESHGRVVITTSEAEAGAAIERAKLLGVSAARIGTVTGGGTLDIAVGKTHFSCELNELHDVWWNTIARAMEQ